MTAVPTLPNLVALLRCRAEEQPDKMAYTFLFSGRPENETITYAQLDQQARQIATQLQHLHAQGQRVLLLYPPGLAYIAAFFGCLYAGAVAVPTYPPEPYRLRQTLPRFQAIIKDAQPAVALTTTAWLHEAQSFMAANPARQTIRWIATDTLADDLASAWLPPSANRETLAFLQYTSGSTAAPKGVMVSHGNLLHNLSDMQHVFQLSAESVSLTWLPHIHDMGLIDGILQPLYSGCPGYLMSPLIFIQRPLRWLQAITEFRVDHSGGPNFGYELCVRKVTPEQAAQLDLGCWRSAYNGAEPVRASTIQQFSAHFAPAGFRPNAFYPCYGLAEATLIVSGGTVAQMPAFVAFSSAGLQQKRAEPVDFAAAEAQTLVSCGWVVQQDTQIVIVDPESCRRCPDGQIGEIWVCGPGVAQGYWQRPEQTAATFAAYTADTGEGPFMRTGDLGFVYAGELFVAGRIKDLIILNGRNYYPQDIEEAVENSHAAVRPGCVATFSIDRDGAERLIVVAEVQPATQMAGSEGDMAVEIRRAIQRAIVQQHDVFPDDVVLLKDRTIPKTSSGKIQRHACRQAYLTGSLELWSTP
ncbi:MAG: fatty acyl-AMP ligase [Candidatus Promineifilaceae bacterium]